MVAPARVGSVVSNSSQATTLALTAPTGTASGDHQLAVVAVGTGSETWSAAPSGWTLQWDSGSIGGADTYRVAIYSSDTDTGTATFGKSGTRLFHGARTSWRGGPGFDFTTDANNVTASGTSHAFPSQSVTVADSVVFGVSVIDTGPPGGTNAWTKPAAWDTEELDVTAHGAQPEDISIGIFTEVSASTGTITGSATSSLTDVAAVYSVILTAAGPPVAAPPTFGAAGTYLAGATRTSTNVPVPAGVVSGSVVIVDMYLESTAAVTPPTGFTEITTAPATTAPSTHRQFWKRATTTDSGTYNFTHASAYTHAVAVRYAGVIATGTPYEASNTASRSSNATGTPAVSNTTLGAQRLLHWSSTSVGAGGWTPPSSWTERVDATDEITVATLVKATAGASGSIAGVGPSGFMTARLIALLPVPTAVAPTVNAGTNATIDQYDLFNRIATEDDGGDTITARTWTVVSGPNQVGATLDTDATIAWSPTIGGSYVLRYSATNSIGVGTDDVTVTVNSLNFPVTAALVLSGTRITSSTRVAARSALLHLATSRIGKKAVPGARTGLIRLAASSVGQKTEIVASTPIRLHASVETSSSQGAHPTALLKLHASAVAGRVTNGGPVSGLIRLHATRVGIHRGALFPTAPIKLHASIAGGTKNAVAARTAPIRIFASVANRSHVSIAQATAWLHLHADTSGEHRTSVGFEVEAVMPLHTSTVTSSIRTNPALVTATLHLAAFVSTQRIVAEITAIQPRADTTVKYIMVCVARIPQAAGPPNFIEVDPIDWTSINYTEALDEVPTLSASVKVNKLTEPVLQRIRTPHELPTEIWLFRNGKRVFSGPLLAGNVGGESVTFSAQGAASYVKFWHIVADMNFTNVDQSLIVKALIDQWQNLEYGNFGIDTSAVIPSGILRTISYPYTELHKVDQRITDLAAMGFNWGVNPASRALEIWAPTRGVDRSVGEDAIVFDARNVTSSDLTFSVAPGDLASEGLATGTVSGSDLPIVSTFSNAELRARFGRIGWTGNFEAADQGALDASLSTAIGGRGEVLLVPGPNARVTLDSDLASYDVGDSIGYLAHGRLSVAGAYRIRKRAIVVGETGTEAVSIEFV